MMWADGFTLSMPEQNYRAHRMGPQSKGVSSSRERDLKLRLQLDRILN